MQKGTKGGSSSTAFETSGQAHIHPTPRTQGPALVCSSCSCSCGLLTGAPIHRVSSPVLPRQGAGPAFPRAAIRISSLVWCCSLRASWGMSPSLTPPHERQVVAPVFPCSGPWCLLYLCPLLQDQICCNAQARYRAYSLECCSWWGHRQLSYSHDPRAALSAITGNKGLGGGGHHSLTHTMADEERSPISWAHVLRAAHLHTYLQGSALLCYTGEAQGPLSQVLQLVRRCGSSLACHKWQVTSGKGERTSFPHAHLHMADESDRTHSLALMPWGTTHSHPQEQGQLYIVLKPVRDRA